MKKPEIQDGYSNFPLYVFHQGRNYRAQEFFGAHKAEDGA